MPPRALPCRPDALPFDRVVRIAVREQSTMDRDCVALFVSPRTTFLELACGCSAAAARSPAVSLRGLLRGRPTHRHLPYGAVWIDISVLVPRTARPARLSSGANLATIGIGTETSGSILSPSGQNSLVGIKPTHARASTRRTRPPPLARRVEYGVPRLAV